MFALKTEKETRYFCSFCKSTLIVSQDTDELFIAVCPSYHRYNSHTHDNLHLSFPASTVESCPHCRREFRPGVDCLDSKNHWCCPHCNHRLRTSPTEPFPPPSNAPRSPMVQEALRIFSRSCSSRTGFYRGTPITWRTEFIEDEVGPGVAEKCVGLASLHDPASDDSIVLCGDCGTKNRMPKQLRSDGFYSCHSCKTVFESQAPTKD